MQFFLHLSKILVQSSSWVQDLHFIFVNNQGNIPSFRHWLKIWLSGSAKKTAAFFISLCGMSISSVLLVFFWFKTFWSTWYTWSFGGSSAGRKAGSLCVSTALKRFKTSANDSASFWTCSCGDRPLRHSIFFHHELDGQFHLIVWPFCGTLKALQL